MQSKSGTVKWFNETKGFGFIVADGKDYFVHYAEIVGEGFKVLKEGQKVLFQSESSAKGPVARAVVLEKQPPGN